MDFRINPDFVPIKVLYFLFMAAFSCMIPYLPVYFVDLGLGVWQIGIMKGMEPITVFLLSPVWGAVADRFSKHKSALVLALIGTGIFYFSIVFVPLISGQFTTTLLNNVTELYRDLDFESCVSSESFVFPSLEVTSEGACQELCKSASHSPEVLSEGNRSYACTGIKDTWECFPCPSNDSATYSWSRGVSGPRNLTVTLMPCEHLEMAATYSPLGDAPGETVLEGGTCDVTVSCECDITDDVRTPKSQRITFSLCFLLVILSVVFNCNILAFLDALLMQKLGPGNRKDYGKHRMWGAVGFGIMAFVSGWANEFYTYLTNSSGTRYEPVFFIFVMCMLISVIVAIVMDYPEHEKPEKMHQDLFLIFKKPSLILFLFVLAVEGISFGMCFSFVLIFLTSVLHASHTLMGLAILVSTLAEIPALFASGKIIKVIHYEGVVYLTLAAYALRYLGYAFIHNAWWVLPFQALHGITFGLGWPGFTHFAIANAPKGMTATLQAIMLGTYIGVGVAIGNFFGGFIVDGIGFRKLFMVNVGLLVFTAIVFFIVNHFLIKRPSSEDETKPTVSADIKEVEDDETKATLNGNPHENKGMKDEGENMLNEDETSKV